MQALVVRFNPSKFIGQLVLPFPARHGSACVYLEHLSKHLGMHKCSSSARKSCFSYFARCNLDDFLRIRDQDNIPPPACEDDRVSFSNGCFDRERAQGFAFAADAVLLFGIEDRVECVMTRQSLSFVIKEQGAVVRLAGRRWRNLPGHASQFERSELVIRMICWH